MSGPIGRLLALIVATLASLGALTAGATAQEPLLQMTNLRVGGGEANWHAEPRFRLDWDQYPAPPAQPGAVVYRLYDPQGQPIGDPVRSTEVLTAIGHANVPSAPGIYTIEAWLENREGQPGSPVTASLRFDDTAPPPAAPQAPAGWVTGGKPVTIPIGHPAPPYPLAGIGGYAVSVDRGGGTSPCAAVIWCSPEEIDLAGGVGDDSASLGVLPEGVYVVRVATVSGSGVPAAVETATLRVDATPPDVALENPPAGWSGGPVQVTAVAHDELSGMAASASGSPFTAIAVDGGLPVRANGERVSAWVRGSGVHELSFYASDAAGNVADGQGSSPQPGQAWVGIDEEPPSVAFVPRRDPGEPERIEATVADALSGPSARSGSIEVRLAGSGERFEQLPTAVAAGKLVAHWDSDSYPTGTYEFRASGYDAVGNSAHGLLRSDGARMVLTNPLKTPVELRAGFAGKRRKQIPYGRGARYSGHLWTVWGEPVAGAAVTVTEAFADGAAASPRRTLTQTRADGSFSVYLAPGPNREVSASFAGGPLLSRTVGAGARLAVRSAVRLRASTAVARVGGAPVVFSGRVARTGARAPKETEVELQFRYPGADWSEFRTVKTSADGRFRYRYRFSDDDSRGIRFQFRAVVPAQKGWPYDPGASRPVIVTGR
jgi:hypothetical protein